MNKEGKDVLPDVKAKVMTEIKRKRIKMICPLAVFMKKLGMESAVAGTIIVGAFLLSATLYFVKKTGLLKFLSLGTPGIRVFLGAIPYDYIALFLLALLLAVYFSNKADFCYQEKISTNLMLVLLFSASVLVGVFFAFFGIQEAFKGFSKNKLPEDMAIWGRIRGIVGERVTLEEEDGNILEVVIDKNETLEKEIQGSFGKIFRATGWREKSGDKYLFHAREVLCCDED